MKISFENGILDVTFKKNSKTSAQDAAFVLLASEGTKFAEAVLLTINEKYGEDFTTDVLGKFGEMKLIMASKEKVAPQWLVPAKQ